ncbi:MAG: methylenetetrahydrofolate reductase [Pseudomonadota bacterium]
MSHAFSLSFEFFPPKSLEASFKLWSALDVLHPLAPEFVSVTYGAGGSTRDVTTDAVGLIRREYGLPVAGHLTCVDASRAETLNRARAYAAKGATKIVALRGDPPKDAGQFVAHPDGFASSIDLISALADIGTLDILCSAHPHPHPEAKDAQADLDWLRRKADAGASAGITQFFFEPEDFLRLRDKSADAGIKIPLLPGILPIENFPRMARFARACGIPIPWWLREGFNRAEAGDTTRLFATATATELCDGLLQEGVDHLHIYTLNDPTLTYDVCRALGRTLRQTGSLAVSA